MRQRDALVTCPRVEAGDRDLSDRAVTTQTSSQSKTPPLGRRLPIRKLLFLIENLWLRGQDLNLRPLGYEPNELPGCSTPRLKVRV